LDELKRAHLSKGLLVK